MKRKILQSCGDSRLHGNDVKAVPVNRSTRKDGLEEIPKLKFSFGKSLK